MSRGPACEAVLLSPRSMSSGEWTIDQRGSLTPGTMIGSYRLETPIGEGGMGTVYRAVDTKLNRPVAIKFLSSELADVDARRRFQREAQMASSLNHPHILTVYDVGEFEGRQYIVTEFVDGGTLKDWAKSEKRTWRQCVELLTGVADGLAAAHQAGILHRDIKPGNILVAKNGYAKLADFGLAKLQEPSDPETTVTEGQTRPGMVVGTIAYMSPEQASGNPLDPRSDIFSFGVVLYELLAGKRPFAGATELEVLKTIIHGHPEPLSADIPQPVRGVVEKALEKDPAERYQTMKDVVVDLRRNSRQGVVAPSRLPWKWIAAVVIFLLMGGAVWRFWPHAGPQQLHSIAVLPMRDVSATPDPALAAGMTETLTTSLGQVSALTVIAPASAARYQDTQKTNPEVGRELNVDGLLASSLQRSGDQVLITARLIEAASNRQIWTNNYTRDLRDVLTLENEVAGTIASEIQAKLTPQERARLATTRTVNPEAQRAYFEARYRLRNGGFQQLFDSAKLSTEKDPGFSEAWALLGNGYGTLISSGVLPEPDNYPKWKQAVDTAVRLDPNSAEAHNALAALLLFHDWNWQEAEREFERAIQLNPNLSEIYSWYAGCLSVQGRLPQALAAARKGVQLDPFSTAANQAVAQQLYYSRRYDELLEQAGKLLLLDANLSHHATALAYEQKGDYARAISFLEMSPDSGADTAHAYALAGKKEQALKEVARLRDLAQRRPVMALAFAIAYTGLGDYDRAFQYLDKAFEERNLYLGSIKVDPRFDPLRAYPRYHRLLQRMRLQE